MRKALFWLLPILLVAGWGIQSAGIYPVAIVDGSPIFSRTWRKANIGAMRFLNATAYTSGFKPVDFSLPENKELLRSIEGGTLTFLIEDKIILREGKGLEEKFESLSDDRIDEALRQIGDAEQKAALIYGLSAKDLRMLVLRPQARRDVLKKLVGKKGVGLEEWMARAKQKTSVRMLLTSFYWNGERVD